MIILQDVQYRYRRSHGAVRRRIDGKNVWVQLEKEGNPEQWLDNS